MRQSFRLEKMPGFSLDAVARPAKANAGTRALSVQKTTSTSPTPLKASAIVEGPKPPKLRRRQATAECVVAIYPYSRDAATVWEECAGKPGLTLWQVQVDHNATNSITMGFYDSFTKFLQQDEDAPDSMKELSEKALIKLVVADSSDPDDAGFVRWRAAFYVAGTTVDALNNLLYLLDGYFVWVNEGRDERVTTGIVFLF